MGVKVTAPERAALVRGASVVRGFRHQIDHLRSRAEAIRRSRCAGRSALLESAALLIVEYQIRYWAAQATLRAAAGVGR